MLGQEQLRPGHAARLLHTAALAAAALATALAAALAAAALAAALAAAVAAHHSAAALAATVVAGAALSALSAAHAAAEEKVILKPPAPATAGEPAQKPADGKRRAICIYLNRLIVERLIQAYEEASTTVPRDFQKDGYMLPASGVATHAEGSPKKAGYVPETSMFAWWRTQHEQAALEENQAGGAGPSGAPPKKKPRKK